MNIPQFLYVPRINTLGTTKLIVETRQDVYWQVLEFANREEFDKWFAENNGKLQETGALTFNAHRKYPFALICIGVKNNIEVKELVKLGNMASDWYAQFHLKNQELTKPIFTEKMGTSEKAKEYFKHWIWGDNLISHEGKVFLVNLEYGVSIRFDYGDAFWATFEDFENSISDVQFLSGERPENKIVEKLIIDAWNFLGIQERIEDGYEIDDIDDEIY